MKLKLTLRDLFWLVLVAACLCGWWVERSRLRAEIDATRFNDILYTVDLSTAPMPPDEPIYMGMGRDR